MTLTIAQAEATWKAEEELPPAIHVEDLWFAYRPGAWVLKGVNLRVPAGGFWAVMGPSGAGKTTLMRLLAGLLPLQRGRVTVQGRPLHIGPPPGFRRIVGYIPQQLGLVRGLTALENVLLGALARHDGWGTALGLFPQSEIERARSLLAMLGLADKAEEKVFRLSGGERQRVAIARTLMQDPQILLADEFVSDLDLPRAAQVLAFVRAWAQERNLTVVMNLHEIQLVQEFADSVAILKDGRVVETGPAAQLGWPRLRELLEEGGSAWAREV